MNLVELGMAFKAARLQARRTQQEVADLTGISRSRISAFENGGLPELGVVKVLSLFETVGLQLVARPLGQGHTLDDLVAEQFQSVGGAHASDIEHVLPKSLFERNRVLRQRVRNVRTGEQDFRSGLASFLKSNTGKKDPKK